MDTRHLWRGGETYRFRIVQVVPAPSSSDVAPERNACTVVAVYLDVVPDVTGYYQSQFKEYVVRP